MLTHSHWCKHCDIVTPCKSLDCTAPRDWSKIHPCGERIEYLKAMRRLLGRACKYNCTRPCNHPDKWQAEADYPTYPRMRPIAEPVKLAYGETIKDLKNANKHADECICQRCRLAWMKEKQREKEQNG